MNSLIIFLTVLVSAILAFFLLLFILDKFTKTFPKENLNFRIRIKNECYRKYYRPEVYRKFWGWTPFSINKTNQNNPYIWFDIKYMIKEENAKQLIDEYKSLINK